MNLTGDNVLIKAYCRTMCLDEIGEHALGQLKNKVLKLSETSEGTHFNGSNNTLNINITKLSLLSPELQCATLCHETFHFFHKSLDSVAYKTRNTSNASITGYGNEEELLTITGKCKSVRNNSDGWDHKLFNENAVLKSFGLDIRKSHGDFSESSSATEKRKAVAFDIIF